MKNLLETSIMSVVKDELYKNSFGWNDFCTDSCIKTIFESMAIFLGRNKSKDQTVAVIIKDYNDKFVFAAYVQFHKQQEEGADEGSWTLNFTYDENDIDTKNWKIYYIPDDQEALAIAYDVAFSKYGIRFIITPKDNNDRYCAGSAQFIFLACLRAIHDYMRANVTKDPILQITDFATLTSEINGDSVYIGIEPSALLKQHVKDDSDIDKVDTNNIPKSE